MATVRITYWRDIPMLVTARDGGGEVSVPLGPAFQDLVDRVAMQDGLGGRGRVPRRVARRPARGGRGRGRRRRPRPGRASSRPASTPSATAISAGRAGRSCEPA